MHSTISHNVIWIDNQDTLDQYLSFVLDQTDIIAIDTEFMRIKTYYPILCTLQICAANVILVIDMTVKMNFDLLKQVLVNDKIIKVIHASEQDIETIYSQLSVIVQPIFDTQVAAAFCHYPYQSSYESLVYKITGIMINKESRICDWQQRPLNEKQIAYAANDVRYLIEIYHSILSKLEKLGRKKWVEEECRKIELFSFQEQYKKMEHKIVSHYCDQNLIQRIKIFLQWRENKAILKNVPRTWIMGNQDILELCKYTWQLSENYIASHLPKILIKKHLMNYKNDFIHLIMQFPSEKVNSATIRYDTFDDNIAKQLKKMLSHISDSYHKIICSYRELKKIIIGYHQYKDVDFATIKEGWRYLIFGKAAIALLKKQKEV